MDTRFSDGVETILSEATATGDGASFDIRGRGLQTYQVYGKTTAGAGAATVKIQVSNFDGGWLDLATITLTLGTTIVADGFPCLAPWAFVRAKVTAISGTGASVSAICSVALP